MRSASDGFGGERHRVLIADDDTPFARRLSAYLGEQGLECRMTSTISDAKHFVELWEPDSIFIDLMLPETNALTLCKFIHSRPLKKVPKVIVMSSQTFPQGVETMRRAGAAHYLEKPFSLDEAFQVVEVPETAAAKGSAIQELHLLNLFLEQALIDEKLDKSSLNNLMRMISLKVHAPRCSVIRCENENSGLVVASNEGENIGGMRLELAAYPEVREVCRTKRPLIIPNVRSSPLLAPVAEFLEGTGFTTFAVFPLFQRNQFYGVLSLRFQQQDKVEINYVQEFGMVCSQIISLAIAGKGP